MSAGGLAEITAAVLAGGLGSRLRSVVADRPKVLAPVNGRPFLTYLLDQLVAAGCRSVVLCTGYLGEQIVDAIGERYQSLSICYSQEPKALGTGGALRLALSQFTSDPVLVLNGDSFFGIDLTAYRDWHRKRTAAASLALARVSRTDRYGRVKIDAEGRIAHFAEKQQGADPGWINAGIYLLSAEVLASIPEGKTVSLEHEVFPQWTGRGLYGYYSPARFLDIGTPEDFAAADDFFRFERMRPAKRTIVLDRDGTIIEEREYLSDPRQVALIPGAAAALRDLQRSGFKLVVITNQSGIARGFFGEPTLQQIHRRLEQLLADEGVYLDGIYICPHKPEDDCSCRKPKLGLLQQAASQLGFTPDESIVIGDKPCDIDMGRNAGAVTFLVRTGYGARVEAEGSVTADYVVNDLPAALGVIRQWLPAEGAFDHDHQ